MSVFLGEAATFNNEAKALINCHDIEMLLYDCVTGVLDEASAEFQHVQNHVKTCKRCFGEEQKLMAMIEEVRKESLEEETSKTFDFASSLEPEKSSLWETVKSGTKSLQTGIKIFVQENHAAFVPLPISVGLRLAEVQMATPGEATRSLTTGKKRPKDDKTRQVARKPIFQLLEIEDKSEEILVELKLKDTSAIDLRLMRLDRSQEIEFAEIKLIEPLTGQIVDGQITDGDGKVRLRKLSFLPENAYVIRIKHEEKRWQINLSIVDRQDND